MTVRSMTIRKLGTVRIGPVRKIKHDQLVPGKEALNQAGLARLARSSHSTAWFEYWIYPASFAAREDTAAPPIAMEQQPGATAPARLARETVSDPGGGAACIGAHAHGTPRSPAGRRPFQSCEMVPAHEAGGAPDPHGGLPRRSRREAR